MELLLEVNAAGQTLVVVTHDEVVGRSGLRLVQMDDGQIMQDGDTLIAHDPEPIGEELLVNAAAVTV